MKRVLVYSGGLDSTVLLYHAVNLYGKDKIEAITFDYGSKHNAKEIECAIWNCKKLGVEHKLFHLESIGENFKSSLLKGGEKIPYGHYAEENMKKTVVPQRNGIMLLIAAGYTESIGGGEVWIASHSGDHFIYRDCTPEYNVMLNGLIRYGSEMTVELRAPFIKLFKWDIVEKGRDLGVDFAHTWSCYEGKNVHCGKCGTCSERIEAFQKAGVVDPLIK